MARLKQLQAAPASSQATPESLATAQSVAQARYREFMDLSLADLNAAIAVFDGADVSSRIPPRTPPRTFGQALAQRGMLHLLEGRRMQGVADLERAAAAGNMLAQQELVNMNPIAQLNSQFLPSILHQIGSSGSSSSKSSSSPS